MRGKRGLRRGDWKYVSKHHDRGLTHELYESRRPTRQR
jgi:hypothetical protein